MPMGQTKELVELLCAFSRESRCVFQDRYVIARQRCSQPFVSRRNRTGSQILVILRLSHNSKKLYRSKKMGLLDPYLSACLTRSSKRVNASKRNPNFVGNHLGFYASVRYILDHIDNPDQKNILLFGMGKIGRNTVRIWSNTPKMIISF